MESASVGGHSARGAGVWLLAFAGIAAISLAVYRDALRGELVSDDRLYLVAHPHTQELSLENVREIVDPRGAAKYFSVNYAPVHLLLSAVEVELFGDSTFGPHVVNVLLHAANAVIFAALLTGSGVRRNAALAAALLFALHPANVEAVAWISQSKTLAAFTLGFGALLAMNRRPLLAMLLFAAAMLTKFLAVSLLPTAAAFAWARSRRGGQHLWRWLIGWTAIAVAITGPQLMAFVHGGHYLDPALDDPWVHLRTVAAVGARYLVMASTTWGLSLYHEPPPALAWDDPWWLAGLFLGVALILRVVVTLRRRGEEAAWWICAAASFGPISQIMPFYHAIADRYLYFILPGLIGGALLWTLELRQRLAPQLARRLSALALVGSLVVALFFGGRSMQRARIWQNDELLLADAAGQYPEGTKALYIRAVNAAQRGDVAGAVAALREAERTRNLSRVHSVGTDPLLEPIRDTREFQDYLREVARDFIEAFRDRGSPSPLWVRPLAASHALLGEYDEAIAVLERAIRSDEQQRSVLLTDLDNVRRARREARESALPATDGSEAAPDPVGHSP